MAIAIALPVEANVGVTLDALVILPSAPTTITGITPALPYVLAVTPDGGNATVVLDTLVILPSVPTTNAGMIVALP